LLAVIAGLVAATVPAAAATCSVPSAPHPTIQAAIDDVGCDPIVVAAGTYVEAPVIARSVSVQGAGSGQTFVQGQVEVQGGTVSLTGLNISAPGDALVAHSGAEVSGFDLEVFSGFVETPIFADGFEDGTTGAWAGVVP
jgi:hypothetical protein